ncbi:hypothetical protein OXX80_000758 [Metschnikowia pulcherrima]
MNGILEKGRELPISFFDAESTSRYHCQLCEFHRKWGRIVDYNMVVGVISPNLLLLNFFLISYALAFRKHAEPCSNLTHRHVRQTLLTRLGYVVLGLAIMLVLGAGAVVWKKVH